MKKKLIITTIDGKTFERDLDNEAKTLPIGSNANHEHYAGLCNFIAVNGMPIEADKTHINYLPPSQIKSVKVEFTSTIITTP